MRPKCKFPSETIQADVILNDQFVEKKLEKSIKRNYHSYWKMENVKEKS